MIKFKSGEEYIANCPREHQAKLQEVRNLIKKEAPEAEEKIGYGMPGYYLNGPLIYFSLAKNHLGIYPTGVDLESEIPEVGKYRTGKGTLQFPLDQELPISLIKKIVQLRVKQNQQ